MVGAHALAVHGIPRATGDLDLWVRPNPENAQKVWHALIRFGAPVDALDLKQEDLTKPGTVFQLGIPPRRIDILTEIDGVDFEGAWEARVFETVAGLEVAFLDRETLLKNKRASGRAKDLADVEMLEGSSSSTKLEP